MFLDCSVTPVRGLYGHVTSVRTQRLLPLSFLLLSCAHASGLGPAPYSSSHRDLPARPKIVTVTDSALASLGLPSLATASLPPEYRELRISRGHGMILGAEYPLVRIVESRSDIVGEVIRFRAILSGSADNVRLLRWAARVETSTARIDWHRVVTLLDAAGIAAIDAPNDTTGYMDAGDLVVEVLHGSRYRAYEVNAPQLRTDSISRGAARIAALIDSVARLTSDHK